MQWTKFGNPWKKGLDRKLCYLLKIIKYQCRKYQFNNVSTSVSTYNTRNTNNILLFKAKRNLFQNLFYFPSAVIQWNKLDQDIHHSGGSNIFKKILLKFIHSTGSTVFNRQESQRVKLLTSWGLRLKTLSELKFNHSFQARFNLKLW